MFFFFELANVKQWTGGGWEVGGMGREGEEEEGGGWGWKGGGGLSLAHLVEKFPGFSHMGHAQGKVKETTTTQKIL